MFFWFLYCFLHSSSNHSSFFKMEYRSTGVLECWIFHNPLVLSVRQLSLVLYNDNHQPFCRLIIVGSCVCRHYSITPVNRQQFGMLTIFYFSFSLQPKNLWPSAQNPRTSKSRKPAPRYSCNQLRQNFPCLQLLH